MKYWGFYTNMSLLICTLLFLLLGGCAIQRVTPEGNWRLDKHDVNDPMARQYFLYFLALQHELVYEVAHPDLYERIDEWMEHHEPLECGVPPEYVGGGGDDRVFCSPCDLVGYELVTEKAKGSDNHIVTGYDSLELKRGSCAINVRRGD